MLDIHCHILPCVDDGAASYEAAIQMARAAEQQGIRQIVATPHHKNPRFENTKDQIIEAVEALNNVLKKEAIELTVLPGQECRVFGEILDDYQKGEVLSVNNNGKYVLVEFPSNHVPRYIEQLFFDMQISGLTPIIVHPERNSEIVQSPDILLKLVKGGALSQVTASSLVGHFGKKISRFSSQLIESGLTHLIASDAHNTTTRGFYLREAYDHLQSQFGGGLRMEFEENAELLVRGETLYLSPPTPMRIKKFLGLF